MMRAIHTLLDCCFLLLLGLSRAMWRVDHVSVVIIVCCAVLWFLYRSIRD
jgi:hypothetical protein